VNIISQIFRGHGKATGFRITEKKKLKIPTNLSDYR
jgi:hypothetical protein